MSGASYYVIDELVSIPKSQSSLYWEARIECPSALETFFVTFCRRQLDLETIWYLKILCHSLSGKAYLISDVREAIFESIECDCAKEEAILRLHLLIVNLLM